jgi:DNA-binding IclR family transcriptional regulator
MRHAKQQGADDPRFDPTIAAGLDRALEDGFAVSQGEWEAGLSGVAAPVFNAGGAIAVSAPTATARLQGEKVAEHCRVGGRGGH